MSTASLSSSPDLSLESLRNCSASKAGDSRRNNSICMKKVPECMMKNNFKAVHNLIAEIGAGTITRIHRYVNKSDKTLLFVDLESVEHAEIAIYWFNTNKDKCGGINASFSIRRHDPSNSKDRREEVLSELKTEKEMSWDQAPEIPNVDFQSIDLAKVTRTTYNYVNEDQLIRIDPSLNFSTSNNFYLRKKIQLSHSNHGWQTCNGRLMYSETSEVSNSLKALQIANSVNATNTKSHSYKYLQTPTKCFVCDKETFMKCDCCQKFCCSVICQRSAENHKEYILKETTTAPIESFDSEYNRINCTGRPDQNSKIEITSIINSNTLYVRSLNSHWNEAYIKLLNDVKCYDVQTAGVLLENSPTTGEILLAKFEGDESYHRAIVLQNVSDDEIYVAYLEFGNVMMLDKASLKPLSKELQRANVLIHRIQLDSVTGDINSACTINYLEYVTRTRRIMNIVYQGNRENDRKCDLIFDNSNQWSMNAQIKSFYEVEILLPNDKEVQPYREMDCIVYSSNERKQQIKSIRIVSLSMMNNNIFFFVDEDNWDDYLNIHKIIEYYEINLKESSHVYQQSYVPRMNEACMVKIKDKWYRAVHEENKNEFYRLHLIDYAVEVCASYKDIRKMPFKLYRQPNYLFDASIDGLPPILDDNHVKQLQEILTIQDQVYSVQKIDFVPLGENEEETTMAIRFDEELHNQIIDELKSVLPDIQAN